MHQIVVLYIASNVFTQYSDGPAEILTTVVTTSSLGRPVHNIPVGGGALLVKYIVSV